MFALCAMGLTGCYNWRTDVMRTASIQHACPVANIQVLNDEDYGGGGRTVALRVCRERRIYQQAGSVWVDQTPVVPATPVVVVRPADATPAPEVREGIFARFVRTRIDWYRAQILACTGGPTAVVAEWTEGPVRISVRGESDVAVAQCVVSAIGTIEVPRGTVQGRLIHPIAP